MKHTWMIGLTILTALTCLLSRVSATEGVLENYNVVWTTPSQNSHGSMPLGNGDVGVNVWVEPSGDLVFFISKTDAWDENCRLCKLGRVRVTFDPPLPVDDSFRQELKLREGVIEISADTSKLALWVDANHPVVRLEAQTDTPTTCRANLELWREQERPFGQNDDGRRWGEWLQSEHVIPVLPDTVVQSDMPRIVWYHRNTRSIYPVCFKIQHLEPLQEQFTDPLLNHTYGASLSGPGLKKDGDKTLVSGKPAKQHALSAVVLATQTDTSEAWLDQLDRLQTRAIPNRKAHEAWWNGFWGRSWHRSAG